MGTIVGVECPGGTVLAGDRRATDGTTVSGDTERVFDFGLAGAAAADSPGDVSEFGRRVESEVRTYATEFDAAPTVQWLARTAATVAEDTGVDAIVAARDDDGRARLREVGSDGRVLADERLALGSGAPVAFGRLDGADLDVDLDAAVELVEDALAAVAERDTDTGDEVDVWRLESAVDGE